jgi:hypothetical protein
MHGDRQHVIATMVDAPQGLGYLGAAAPPGAPRTDIVMPSLLIGKVVAHAMADRRCAA